MPTSSSVIKASIGRSVKCLTTQAGSPGQSATFLLFATNAGLTAVAAIAGGIDGKGGGGGAPGSWIAREGRGWRDKHQREGDRNCLWVGGLQVPLPPPPDKQDPQANLQSFRRQQMHVAGQVSA